MSTPSKTAKILGELRTQAVLWFPFVFAIVVIGAISVLFFYQSVASKVNRTSRCKQLRDRYASSGVYSVQETSLDGVPLYEVSYNLAARKSSVECRCPKGSILNQFKFTLRDLYNGKNRPSSLNCECDDDYAGSIKYSDPFSRAYEGFPELVNYMKDTYADQFFRKPASISY